MSNDMEVLPGIGLDFIVKVVRIIVETLCYGVYILLFTLSVRVLRRRAPKSIPALILLVFIFLMFTASSLFLAMDIVDIIRRFQIILIDNPGLALQQKLDHANSELMKFVWTGEMLFIFMLVFGDSIVVWRTWAIYYDSRYFLLLPIITWTGSAVAAFYELGCDIHIGWRLETDSPSAGSVGAASCAKADTISFSLSYATNIICTFLIFLKTWQCRRGLKEFMESSRRKTQAEKILVLLVESGAIYLAVYTFQALPIYGKSFNAHSLIVVEAVNAIVQQAIGMYPTAIIVLVEMQKSLWDTEAVSRQVSQSIQFTSTPLSTRASRAEEIESRLSGYETSPTLARSTSDIMLTPVLKTMASKRSFGTLPALDGE